MSPIEAFFSTARNFQGAVAGPFATRQEAVRFRHRANAYRRQRLHAGDMGLVGFTLRLTPAHEVVAEPVLAPPIRPL